MLLIVISSPESYPNEHKILVSLFNQGLEIFHLRKPGFSFEDMDEYLQSIPVEFHPRIVIHSHYPLANRYNIKGIHLTEKSRKDESIEKVSESLRKKTLSASFHSFEEIMKDRQNYDYVFLSPIFDSISKTGYVSNFDLNNLQQCIQTCKKNINSPLNIIALGGINADNIDSIKKTGFAGFAMLGAIWQSQNPLKAFIAIKNKL